MADVNTLWTASAVQTVNVEVTGTGPFVKAKNDFNGTIFVANADGTPALVTRTTDAIEGYSAATSDTGNAVFADNATNNALVDEIIADANTP